MAVLMDGKALAAKLRGNFRSESDALAQKGTRPGLAVVIVGEDPASKIYVRNKQRACEECGIYSRTHTLSAETSEQELIALVHELNRDPEIHGILVQSPLPGHISERAVVENIAPSKDVDAFSYENVGRIVAGDYRFLPCTPAGVMELLDEYKIEIEGKNCVVVGRSDIVGKPQAMMLLHRNGTVTICHSRTKNLGAALKEADIIVAAVGRAGLITGDMVKEGAVVIDVGMNRNEAGKLCGDVDFAEVSPKASFITPVPGGVGPMTITMLMKNTITSAKNAQNG